jgi:hypothetical protein
MIGISAQHPVHVNEGSNPLELEKVEADELVDPACALLSE